MGRSGSGCGALGEGVGMADSESGDAWVLIPVAPSVRPGRVVTITSPSYARVSRAKPLPSW